VTQSTPIPPPSHIPCIDRNVFVTIQPSDRDAGGRMYIDPTSGSLMLQVLAAGALSAVAMVSRVREAAKGLFRTLVSRGRRWTGSR
jgi:hypothetical protein